MRRPTYTDFINALVIVQGWTTTQAQNLTKRPLAESALAAGWAGFGDYEVHPTDAAKAAATGARIAMNHAAKDGNKRVALLLMSAMLDDAGLDLHIADDDLALLFERVAGREPILTEDEFIAIIVASTSPR